MNLPAQQTAAAVKPAGKGALLAKFAEKYGQKFGVDEGKLMGILKATCFKQKADRDGNAQQISDEQMAALLIVADQYNLNPFTREIYAFPDKKNGIVPIVGVDGWARIINEHPAMDGVEFRDSPKLVQMDDDSKLCPEWIEAVIYRKDRSRPAVIREYLDECYKPPFVGSGRNGTYKTNGPWQSHTKRFLRHKALIQGARIAFGFAGVYDEDEAERIAEARVVDMTAGMPAAIDVTPVDTSEFDRLAQERGADMGLLARFTVATASMNQCPVDDVKSQAIANFDGFWSAFEKWQVKQPTAANGNGQKKPRATTSLREGAAKAIVEAGLDLAAIEKDFGAYSKDWSYSQCEQAKKMAADALAAAGVVPDPEADTAAAKEQPADAPQGIPETVECPKTGNVVRTAVECAACDQNGLCPSTDGKNA